MTTNNSLCGSSALWFQNYDKVAKADRFGGFLKVLKAFEENSGTLVTWADIKHENVLDLTTCLW
jgi:hypothetical protein